MSSFASRFKEGSDLAKDLLNTYESSRRKKEIGDISSAAETPAFTADQDAERAAKANAVDADGNPLYTFSADEQGNVSTTLNQSAVPGAAPEAYAPTPMAAKGVTFLGKSYDAPLNEGQRTGARQQAMAGVLERGGDLEGAMRYRQQAQQGELTGMQIDQAKRQGAREDKVDAYETSRQDAFNGSVYGQQNATYAKQMQDYLGAQKQYDEGIAAGRPPQELGVPPVKPSRAAYSLADSLADQGSLLAVDAKHGKVDAKTFGDFSERMRKVEDEGYLKALNLAQGGASLEEVAKAFNASGQIKFDPKNVISDTTAPGQGGVPERVITVKDEAGNPQVINVMSQLKSLGKAGDALTQFYQGEVNKRGNAGEVRAEKSLGIQQAQLGIQQGSAAVGNELHRAQIDELKQKTQDKKDLGDIHDDLNTAIDNKDAKAEDTARKKLSTYMARSRGTNMGTLEMNANLYLASGKAKTMSEALDMAHSKVQSSPKDDYIKLTTGPTFRSPEDLNRDMSTLHGPNWKEKISPSAPTAATFANQAEFDAAVKAGKVKSGDRVSVGGRTATYK